MLIIRRFSFGSVVICALTIKTVCSMPPTTSHGSNEDDAESRQYLRRSQQCDTDQIEYRLTKLEVQVGEKSAQLVSELREGNRRLQAMEFQGAEVESAIEGFRNELGRITEAGRQPSFQQPAEYQRGADKLESRVDNLVKGVQLVVAALRGLNSDIAWVKKNISAIGNVTGSLLQQHNELVTKQFLTNSLVELKHDQVYPQIPANLFKGPDELKSNSTQVPRHCRDVQENGNNPSGIYRIQPEHSHKAFMVLCDMDTKDGGWTHIHNRYEGSQDFYLNWHDYKIGFGNLGGEFWLGLEHVHHLTGHDVNELLVELVDAKGKKAYAHYAAFSVGSEVEGYALKVLGGYNGDAGDSLIYHAGSRFSTKDLDQDSWAEGNCAQAHNGAWWYRSCDTSNLNGKYLNGELPESYLYQGMYWSEFRGAQYSLAQARMMVRPRGRHSPPIFPNGLERSRRT
ncbi:hypothetical protein NQ318_004316 [Aromia moschata]|uniref:Fibrinogen C-terminal domain-containing protein n=1 Tax=Aromia moschata TaxID=1265417 RepID=A0AAV8YRL7_9CUCU|nr:hypothetical protein NQ318_004316 [Aromia moschata]